MRFQWVRSRPRRSAALAASHGLLVLALLYALLPGNPITRENFARIQPGMTAAEVISLLGRPDDRQVMSGRVEGPDEFAVNFSPPDERARARGFRDYRWEQWSSAEITIVVVSEIDGPVVCRYRGDGQRRDWWARLRLW